MIGSHACVALPRATRSSPTAAARRARAGGRPSRRSRRPTRWNAGAAADLEGARRRAPSEAEPGGQLGLLVGAQEEVDGRVSARQAATLSARTEQPVSTTRSAGVGRLEARQAPIRPMTFCSAASRMAQVLMTTRSAASSDAASAQPAASSAPAISSESEWFIWQPRVQTWKRGRTRSSVSELGQGVGRAHGGACRGRARQRGRTSSDRQLHGPVIGPPCAWSRAARSAALRRRRARGARRSPPA